MQKIFRYGKFTVTTIMISIFLLNFPLSRARAVMITTEHVIHQDSKHLSDRARLKAFLERADVMAQMQAYGISHKETLSRVDSLTDNEISLIADKLDQMPAGAYSLVGGILVIIGIAIYAIFAAIVIYFSSTDEQKEKQSQIDQNQSILSIIYDRDDSTPLQTKY